MKIVSFTEKSDMENEFRMMVAPLQGLTEAAWRSVHFAMFGKLQGDVEYFTPFIRVENGDVRNRDMRDYTSELNRGMKLTPQIIFRDVEEWKILVEALCEVGAERIDMNMGCPFVPQVRKGRGAGLLCQRDRIAQVVKVMASYANTLKFSVKMRLGVSDSVESLEVVDILNEMPLRHVAVHPRTAKQQYKGALMLEEMEVFASKLRHPVIFNGGISIPAQIEELTSKYAGVMVGRGLLSRPSLFAEYHSGHELNADEREETFFKLLSYTSSLLKDRLCGETQLRDKMKTYWEYAPATLDRRIVKEGQKKGLVAKIRQISDTDFKI